MSSIRCYPSGHGVRLEQDQGVDVICFELGYWEVEAHVYLSLDGQELRREQPRKVRKYPAQAKKRKWNRNAYCIQVCKYAKQYKKLRNAYGIHPRLLDDDWFELPNGCQLECSELKNALQWELFTPDGLILASLFDPNYDSQTAVHSFRHLCIYLVAAA